MEKSKIFIGISVVVLIIIAIFVLYRESIPQWKQNIAQEEGAKNEFIGLEKNLTELSEDADFYRCLDSYTTLLNEEDYQYIKEAMRKMDESKEIPNFILLPIINELFKDEKVEVIVNNLKDEIYAETKKELTEEKENELFKRNTACADLITGITEQLANKYPKEEKGYKSKTTEKEELEFIFYSPTIKSCLYSTKYTYDYTDDDYEDNYYIRSKIIYNASTKTEIEKFTTYYHNYPYLSKEDATKKSEKDEKNYIKFILENSNYNVDLIKDLSFYF